MSAQRMISHPMNTEGQTTRETVLAARVKQIMAFFVPGKKVFLSPLMGSAREGEPYARAFHDLLHEYDPRNHRPPMMVEFPGGRAGGYSLKFDPDAVCASIQGRVLDEVMVAFGPSCWVVYDYFEKPEHRARGHKAGTTGTATMQSASLISVEYDDPNFLEKIFQAIAKLGVFVPAGFTSSIQRAQQSLSGLSKPSKRGQAPPRRRKPK